MAAGDRKRARTRLASALALLWLAGCGAGTGDEVRVSAAASLGDAFSEIERAFEASAPGVDVVLNLGGSSTLREQVLAGAPVDVFAPANEASLDPVARTVGVVGRPRVFARNRLQIAVPAGRPARVEGLADFAHEPLLLGLCAEGVPCGDLARQVLEAAGVEPAADTHEPNVRALLTKIEAGELDAGIVYASDVVSSDGVEGVEIPAEQNAVAAYPIAQLATAPNPAGASAFVAFVLSKEARSILTRHGFAAP
ncbi:MAG: molybdate ABC transporter substrate-binding protein [Myxococcota bacterium]|nr:molybdate ABC transporter substrate-binding protein [Myxococcota bacterium]